MLLAGEHIFIKKAWKNFPCAFRKTATAFIPAHFRRRPLVPKSFKRSPFSPSAFSRYPERHKNNPLRRNVFPGRFFRPPKVVGLSAARQEALHPRPVASVQASSVRFEAPSLSEKPRARCRIRKRRRSCSLFRRLCPSSANGIIAQPEASNASPAGKARVPTQSPPHPLFTKERFMRT